MEIKKLTLNEAMSRDAIRGGRFPSKNLPFNRKFFVVELEGRRRLCVCSYDNDLFPLDDANHGLERPQDRFSRCAELHVSNTYLYIYIFVAIRLTQAVGELRKTLIYQLTVELTALCISARSPVHRLWMK